MPPTVAVIGGGISGLAAAGRLLEQGAPADVLVLEGGNRLGGVLHTTERDGFLLEDAADGFLTSVPWGVEFAHRVGCQLIPTSGGRQRALVVHRRRLQPIPPGFLVMAPSRVRPILTTPILSVRGKLRLALEYFVPRNTGDEDESLASFVRRRLGHEVYDRLVQPLVGGIYSGDPERLSIEATMPRFKEMEKKHGSLLRAMLKSPHRAAPTESSGARYSQFVAPQGGMSRFVELAAERLPSDAIRLNAPVAAIRPLHEGGWQLDVQGNSPGPVTVDGLIIAAPAFESARLLSRLAPTAAEKLQEIAYSSCALVSLAYRREQIGHPLDGFGFVVPRIENRLILSCSFSSLKYPDRAPDGKLLLRVFIGGALQGHLLGLSDEELVELAETELGDLLAVRGKPLLTHVSRHQRTMPQYHVGHSRRIQRIQESLGGYPTLALAGSGLHGVGIPHCVRSGENAADQVLKAVRRTTTLVQAV